MPRVKTIWLYMLSWQVAVHARVSLFTFSNFLLWILYLSYEGERATWCLSRIQPYNTYFSRTLTEQSVLYVIKCYCFNRSHSYVITFSKNSFIEYFVYTNFFHLLEINSRKLSSCLQSICQNMEERISASVYDEVHNGLMIRNRVCTFM